MSALTGIDEESWVLAVATDDDDALRNLVVETLGHVLDEAPEPDDDGDVPIWIEDVPTYASVDVDAGTVYLTTFLVEAVADRVRATEVLSDLQLEFSEFKFVLHDDRVTAEQRVGACPLVPLHLLRAVGAVVPLAEQARVLASRLGGVACVFDGEVSDGDAESAVGENLLAGGCGCGDCTCG